MSEGTAVATQHAPRPLPPAAPSPVERFDVAVVGAGMSGITAALLLAHAGVRVALLEAHTTPGGCAGYFERKRFSFDVGATTFIGFQEGGLGHRLARTVGLRDVPLARIETYVLCLPDRQVPVPSDRAAWLRVWTAAFPEAGERRERFFRALDHAAHAYWALATRLPSLPLGRARDWIRTAYAADLHTWPALRFAFGRFGTFMERFRLGDTTTLRAALDMLLQDTTQNTLDAVPAPNALLGLTLMPHGLFRPLGGAKAVWASLVGRFVECGGTLRTKHAVEAIEVERDGFVIRVRGRPSRVACRRLISSIPVWNTHEMAPHLFNGRLDRYLGRRRRLDGAFALYLAVRDIFPATACHHYQVLRSYTEPLGEGNNFLISLSPRQDSGYAPPGFRSVTISTHADPLEWSRLDSQAQRARADRIIARFLDSADRLFPGFAENLVPGHFYPASPRTYERFTRRYRGMAGNQPLTLENANLGSVPSSFGTAGFWQIGDTTFPGAGTVACMLSGFNGFRDAMGYLVRAR